MAAIKELLSALMLITGFIANAQKPGWQNLDLAQDQLFGISMAKAYQTLIGNKKPVSVTVAVIDAGAVDIDHPDLKKNIWVNSKEIPGNGIDDDHNGYTDDVYGWDFDGSEKNEAVIGGMTVRDKVFYDSLSYGFIPEEYRGKYSVYRKMLEDYKQQQQIATRTLDELKTFARSLDTLTSRMNKGLSPAYSDFRQYLPKNEEEKELQKKILSALKNDSDYPHFREKKLKDLLAYFQEQSIDRFEQQAGARPNVKEFYKTVALVREWLDLDHLSEPYASHGTHIAGIIGAVRNNGIGIDGIADNVKLMPLHVSSGVYGWEEAISAAIRYAADNGALVINMSINLDYTGNEAKKQAIEQAILYAVSKNILIIHAAGNEKRNIENSRPDYADAWIEVGASGPYDDSTLSAPFSNYGKTAVDVFAPGVNIYSSINGSQYETHSGTSMAAPVVAGLAALIREYYPKLTAKQVKGIIMKSIVKRDILSNKCSSGGVVNAYNALKLASAYKGLND